MKKPQVLIIDDDPEQHAVWQSLTSRYFITFCSTSVAAAGYLENHTVDVILLIYNRGEVADLMQMIRHIKGTEKFSRIPLLCISENKDDSFIRYCFDSGIDMFLPRPLKSDHLISLIQLFSEKKF